MTNNEVQAFAELTGIVSDIAYEQATREVSGTTWANGIIDRLDHVADLLLENNDDKAITNQTRTTDQT